MKPGAWALRHPVPLAVITAGAVLFGIIALLFLNREFVPEMVMPTSSVVTLWPGVGAEDVEKDVTSVLEDHFANLSGLTDLSSESREGVSIIRLQFREDMNSGEMLQEVRTRVDRGTSELPDNIRGKPVVSTWGASDLPVVSFAATGPWDADRLARYVDEILIPEMYKVEGVARAEALGSRYLEVAVVLDPDAMSAVNTTALDVLGAMQGRNTALPAGLVEWDGGEWAFRISGEFGSLNDLETLVVGSTGLSPVYLGDIAAVTEQYEAPDERIRSDGQDLVVIQVTKRENGNAIRMSRDIQSRLESLETATGFSFTMLHDDSETVRLSLQTVLNSAMTGIAMAIAVIWLFLRSLNSTLVIAISLPVSLVITMAGMYIAGQSINVLTMAGITVSLGMVVDASIVILENIHRHSSAGEEPYTAALNGVDEVSGAVLASTTTSVSVFAPMMFLSGIIGSVLKDLSITLVLCLGASMFSAIFLVPPLARKGLERSRNRSEKKPVAKRRLMAKMEQSYGRSLEKVISMSGVIIFAATAILAASFLAADLMGLSFIPAADYGEVFVSLELPPGTSLDESSAAADRAEEVIHREIPELEHVLFYVGMEDELSGDARKREAVWGQLLLKDRRSRKRDFREVILHLNEILPPALPGTMVTVFNGGFDRMVSMGADGAGFRVELSSESWKDLHTAAGRIEDILRADPEILSTTRDVTENRRFITAGLDGEMLGQLGVGAAEAAVTARIAFEGLDAGNYRPPEGTDRKIRLTSEMEGEVPDSSSLNRLPLRSASGSLISLDAVSDISENTGASGIRRRNRARTITVIGHTRNENIREISRRLRDVMEEDPLENVEWKLKGISGLVGDSMKRLGLVLIVSLFLVYAVMAIQFERLVQPLIIMASVPFAFIGVVGGLAAFGSDISMISFLGIVALAGIVVNNAIVQVDHINLLRRKGMNLDEAVIKGAASRLRPILMTTLTTFFGVLPLSLARGSGSRIYAPLGQAIAGGLLTSTLVTLFLVPVLYHLTERRREGREPHSRTRARQGVT